MSVSGEFLDALGEHARGWAKAYVAITESLIREGVPEDVARNEARIVATDTFIASRIENVDPPPWSDL